MKKNIKICLVKTQSYENSFSFKHFDFIQFLIIYYDFTIFNSLPENLMQLHSCFTDDGKNKLFESIVFNQILTLYVFEK